MIPIVKRAIDTIPNVERVIDRAIGIFYPQGELARVKARAVTRTVTSRLGGVKKRSYYEGAKTGRRTENWTTSGQSASDLIKGGMSLLRARSHDLIRNNPWAQRAQDVIVADTVGSGIIPQAKDKKDSASKEANELWKEWGDTAQCDSDGLCDFYGLQSLALRTIFESGSVLIRRRWRGSASGMHVPIKLQLMEPDYLDITKDTLAGSRGNRIVNGVEFSPKGERVAYHLYKELPGTSWSSTESVSVPARDVLHIYRVRRIAQVDDIPWLSAAIIRLHDLDEYEDAELVRKKISACFAAFVKDIDNLSEEVDDNSTIMDKYQTVSPGMLEYLGPGKDITFANPPPAEALDPFARLYLRSIAAAAGCTYEALTGDYSQVNFSSGRMGWLQYHRNIAQWRDNMIIPMMCMGVWSWFTRAAFIAGNLQKDYVPSTWTAPRREMIDPVKETNAIMAQIAGGLLPQQEAIRQQGYDADDVYKDYAEDNTKIKDLGLKFSQSTIDDEKDENKKSNSE